MKPFITKARPVLAKKIGSFLVFCFWIGLWQLIYQLVGREILVVSPLSVLANILVLAKEASFWGAIFRSLTSVVVGFSAALAGGFLLALAAYVSGLFARIVNPLVVVVKSTPVASFILLALFFLPTRVLPGFISFLMVLPLVYANFNEGFFATDKKLLEMATLFRLSPAKKIRYIYLPALTPALLATIRAGLGFSWKAGIAAEVLATPAKTLGAGLFASKIYLDTLGIFSWTAVVVIISMILEKTLLFCLARLWPTTLGAKKAEVKGDD